VPSSLILINVTILGEQSNPLLLNVIFSSTLTRSVLGPAFFSVLRSLTLSLFFHQNNLPCFIVIQTDKCRFIHFNLQTDIRIPGSSALTGRKSDTNNTDEVTDVG